MISSKSCGDIISLRKVKAERHGTGLQIFPAFAEIMKEIQRRWSMVPIYIGTAVYLVLMGISALDHCLDLETTGLCDCEGLLRCRRTHGVAAIFALLPSGVTYLAG